MSKYKKRSSQCLLSELSPTNDPERDVGYPFPSNTFYIADVEEKEYVKTLNNEQLLEYLKKRRQEEFINRI